MEGFPGKAEHGHTFSGTLWDRQRVNWLEAVRGKWRPKRRWGVTGVGEDVTFAFGAHRAVNSQTRALNLFASMDIYFKLYHP